MENIKSSYVLSQEFLVSYLLLTSLFLVRLSGFQLERACWGCPQLGSPHTWAWF